MLPWRESNNESSFSVLGWLIADIADKSPKVGDCGMLPLGRFSA